VAFARSSSACTAGGLPLRTVVVEPEQLRSDGHGDRDLGGTQFRPRPRGPQLRIAGLPDNATVTACASPSVPLTCRTPSSLASSAGRPPAVNQAIFDAYAAWYPGWHVALCCFERSFEAVEPLLWWYEPIDSTRLFAPSLDGHDGKVPHPGAAVDVDHKLVFGSVTKPEGRDAIFTDYTKVAPDRSGLRTELPDDLRALLATKVTGAVFAHRRMPNGDFSLPLAQLAAPDSGCACRLLGPEPEVQRGSAAMPLHRLVIHPERGLA
jgi:hypothetical protein